MKRNILIIALLCLSFWAKAQSGPTPIVLGHIDTVYSEILQEKRPVWVYMPPHDTSYFTKPAYPVLYVLDGDGHFISLVTLVQQLSAVNGNTVLPEMIIVGIPNTRGHRTRDLTPIASPNDKTSGGGENFTAFIEKELVPYIDKNYATAPYRTLMGHSLGGLFAINMLMKHSSLFNAYIALEPSMFFDNDDLLGQTKSILQQKDFKGRSLFVGIANTMNPGMDTLQVRADTTIITHHIRSILKLKDNLQKYPANHLRWDYKYYPDDDHASMTMIAAYDGLRFIFQHNRFPRNQPQNQFFDKSLTPAQIEKMIKEHYRGLSNEMGYDVKPQESYMNMLGYTFLQRKDYDRSRMFFQQNIDYYPGSFNAYDSMGDYYLEIKDKSKAIEYFKRALSIKYRQEIKDKLDKVLNQ